MKEDRLMENDIRSYLESLEASLIKKEKLLVSLIVLTKEQENLLKQEEFDPDAFDEILEEKGERIEEINLLDEGFESIFSIVKAQIMEEPNRYKEIFLKMQNLIKSLTAKGVELETTERRNQLKLETIISRDKTKIKTFHVNNEAAAKYYSSMMKAGENPNFFMDKKK